MIVRILGEGQFDVADSSVEALNALDAKVEAAVEAGDHDAFQAALTELLDTVRAGATPHAAEAIDTSDVVLPPSDATLEEVRDMLSDDGLIPG